MTNTFTCSCVYDVTIGDIEPAEAGSAGGSLDAVRQLADAIDAAVVTSADGHTRTLVAFAAVGRRRQSQSPEQRPSQQQREEWEESPR